MPGLGPSVSSGVRYTWVFPDMAFAAVAVAMWMYEARPIPAPESRQLGLNSAFAQQGRFQPLLEDNVAAFANWYARQMLGTQ